MPMNSRQNRAPTGLRRTTVIGISTKFFSAVGERQVKVIASDGSIDLMGDILEPRGAELDQYRKNPVVRAQHASDAPIARCSYIGVENAAVVATIDFPPAGTSERSDGSDLAASPIIARTVSTTTVDTNPALDGSRLGRQAISTPSAP